MSKSRDETRRQLAQPAELAATKLTAESEALTGLGPAEQQCAEDRYATGIMIDRDSLAQLIDVIDRFVRDRLRPLEQQVADEDRIPPEVVEEMKALGLFGLSIPAEFGGIGLDMSQEVEVALRLGHAAPAFRSVFGTNNGIGSQGIVLHGTEEQKRRYLPRLARGELIASFCLTEPDVGSDAGSLRTTAIRRGDFYVVNGTKRFITHASHAGLVRLMRIYEGTTQIQHLLIARDMIRRARHAA